MLTEWKQIAATSIFESAQPNAVISHLNSLILIKNKRGNKYTLI